MHILLIGGTGVLSTAVTNEALKKNIRVTVINRGNSKAPQNVEVLISDKNNLANIANLLKGRVFDAVIDFLCYTEEDTVKSYNFYKDYTHQYFFISSCAVYAHVGDSVILENTLKPNKLWDYSINKWKSENILLELSKSHSTKVTIIRPSVTYGDTRIPYGVSPKYGYHWTLVERIKNGKPIIRWNNGENTHNVMRVEDFAVGVIGLIGKDFAYGEAYNICSDETPSYNDIIEVLESLIGKKAKCIDVSSQFYASQVPNRKGEILGDRAVSAHFSNSKIKNAVPEFKQSIYLKEGITRTYNAYKMQNYQKGIDWSFDAQCDRIAKQWLKMHHMSSENYNLRFVDYLGNAKINDKIEYMLEFLNYRPLNAVMHLTSSVLGKLKRIFRSLKDRD